MALSAVRWQRAALLALPLALLPSSGRGEIFRCPGPDGRPIFTGDRNTCTRAVRHESSRGLQTFESDEPARRSPSRREAPARSVAESSGADESVWRGKRQRAEAEYAKLEGALPRLREMVTGCNRGSQWYGTDESGLKRAISCDSIREHWRAASEEHARLRAYLDGGLEDECRRAGCLPGWIR